MSEWQPIETAPMSGSVLILWNGTSLGTGYWEAYARDQSGNAIGMDAEDQKDCIDRWVWSGEGFAIEPPPTHWHPMPEPPSSKQHSDNHGVTAHCGAVGNADAQQVGAPSSNDSTGEPTK